MNLNSVKISAVIQEDEIQRIESGTLTGSQEQIILITILNPKSVSDTTRYHMLSHLFNTKAIFDENGHLYIVLSQKKGPQLNRYLDQVNPTYNQRIALGHTLLKAINKYSVFSSTIQHQLLCDSQLCVIEDTIIFREIIDYTLQGIHNFSDITQRLGILLESILGRENKIHCIFIDLLTSNAFDQMPLVKILALYKNVFIYEKQESINKILEMDLLLSNQKTLGEVREIEASVLPALSETFVPEDTETLENNDINTPHKKYIFPLAISFLIVCFTFINFNNLLFKPDTLQACYEVKTFEDGKLSFINASLCSSGIEQSEWRVYYNNKLVDAYQSENFYPAFNTEGTYTVELRVQDKKGNWSDAYKESFNYRE